MTTKRKLPSNKRSGKGAQRHRQRAERHDTWRALQTATREECIRRANKAAGAEFWNENQERYLRATLSPKAERAKEQQARVLYRDLRSILVRVSEFAQSTPTRGSGCATFLRQFAVDFVEPALKQHGFNHVDGKGELIRLYDHAGKERPFYSLWLEALPDEWSARKMLVADWDQHGCWWWPKRRPTRTDLAVLSILAGNWPEYARKSMKTGRADALDPTPASVIAAEANVIDLVRKRLGSSRDNKSKAKPTHH